MKHRTGGLSTNSNLPGRDAGETTCPASQGGAAFSLIGNFLDDIVKDPRGVLFA
jgi:hypothetical protein